MPTAFSAERFYALTGRSAPTRTSAQSQTVSQTLPEIKITGNAQLQEKAFFNNSGDFLFEVYESVCDAEQCYRESSPQYSDINVYSDVRRINAATSFCEATANSALLQSLISGQKINYENQAMLDIIENSSGVIGNQDLQYLKNSSQKIKQYSSDIQKENSQKLIRLSELQSLLSSESKKQGIPTSQLEKLSPEGQKQLNSFLETEYQKSLSLRRQFENAPIQSPEYQKRLAQIRENYDLEKAPNNQDNFVMQQSIRQASFNR